IRQSKLGFAFASTSCFGCMFALAITDATAQQAQRTAARNVPAANAVRLKPGPPTIPKVLLTKQERALCRVGVGDPMPEVVLPQLGGNREIKLSALVGKKATVVVFWKTDRRMTRQQLTDMRRDILDPFAAREVAVVGIAVKESEANAQATLKKLEVKWPNLLDEKGEAFSQVGGEKLPRTYLLDSNGKILWFDLEYSMGTRRDLIQAL